MAAIASEIGEDELAKTAAYFAGLPAPPPDASLPIETAEWRRGAALYQDGDAAAGIARCRSCHDDAEADRPRGPFLKAQHAAYLAKQLRDWRAGAGAHEGGRPAGAGAGSQPGDGPTPIIGPPP